MKVSKCIYHYVLSYNDCSIRVYQLFTTIFHKCLILLSIFLLQFHIIPNAFSDLLCSKLCWHNRLVPTKHMLHNKTNYLLAGLLWWSFFFTAYYVEAHGPSVLYDTTHIGIPIVTHKQNITLATQHRPYTIAVQLEHNTYSYCFHLA